MIQAFFILLFSGWWVLYTLNSVYNVIRDFFIFLQINLNLPLLFAPFPPHSFLVRAPLSFPFWAAFVCKLGDAGRPRPDPLTVLPSSPYFLLVCTTLTIYTAPYVNPNLGLIRSVFLSVQSLRPQGVKTLNRSRFRKK